MRIPEKYEAWCWDCETDNCGHPASRWSSDIDDRVLHNILLVIRFPFAFDFISQTDTRLSFLSS